MQSPSPTHASPMRHYYGHQNSDFFGSISKVNQHSSYFYQRQTKFIGILLRAFSRPIKRLVRTYCAYVGANAKFKSTAIAAILRNVRNG